METSQESIHDDISSSHDSKARSIIMTACVMGLLMTFLRAMQCISRTECVLIFSLDLGGDLNDFRCREQTHVLYDFMVNIY